MSRLGPFTQLILDAVRYYHVKHEIAGWYDVEYLENWMKAQHKEQWKALCDAYRDCPDAKVAIREDIEAYLPSLNQKKLSTRPAEPRGSIILWRVNSRTAPPAEAPEPVSQVKKPRPARVRGQPWIALIDTGDIEGLRRWLNDGGDPNVPGRTQSESPLDYAAGAGEVEMVRLLLERGAKGTLPLFEAVVNFRGATARVLLEQELTLEDLRQASSVVKNLVDDEELGKLIQKALRLKRRK